MCPFFMYFRSSPSHSSHEVEQVDPQPEETKKTKKKKEKKLVCACVHPGAIDTPPQSAPHPFLQSVQEEKSVLTLKKTKPKEPELALESKGKKDN